MLRDVPDEAMLKLFDVRKCHRVKHALPSSMQSSPDTLFLLGSRKTLNSTDHHTEHFPMGGANCCMTFQTQEFLFLSSSEGQQPSPLRGSFSSVRVLLNEEHRTAKWWLRHAPLHPCKVQVRESLPWLMFVALSADHATQNYLVSNLRGRTLLRFTP